MRFILQSIFIVTVIALMGSAPATDPGNKSAATAIPADTMSLQKLFLERKKAANKKRRIIFNNDGNESFRLVKKITAQGVLEPRTLGLEHSQVDAIYYCTSHAWGDFNHETKVGSILTVKERADTATLFKNNVTGELIAAGLDPLKVMVKFANANQKEIFWSMRMNDTHDGGKTGYGPVLFNANKIKTAHPEYLVGKQFEKGAGSWSAANYALPEVRAYTMRFIEDVCARYDVDGIELDFFRHRVFFKSTFKGKKTTDEERNAMTGLMREIRRMTERIGMQRKRPLLVSMRVPDSKEYSFDIGLDIEQWLKEQLLDIMSVSSYIRLNPWQTSVALGHQYGVKVYPSLDESRLNDKESAKTRNGMLSYRAQALEGWHAGADGIYMFNFFDPKSSLWNELGDADLLRKLDRTYYTTVRGAGKSAGLDHLSYLHLPTLNPDEPITVSPQTTVPIEFHQNKNDSGVAQLMIRIKDFSQANLLVVKINDRPITTVLQKNGWLAAKIPAIYMKNGTNTVLLSATQPVICTDVKIDYRSNYAINKKHPSKETVVEEN